GEMMRGRGKCSSGRDVGLSERRIEQDTRDRCRADIRTMPEELSIELIQSALDGDERATRGLMTAILPILHARVGRMLLRFRAASRHRDIRQDVEDLVQQILLMLFSDGGKALRAWDPGRGMSFAGFIGLLAEREIYSILRSRRRSPWTEDPVEA